jgi:uncharacterized damage-inducible protein DinB
MSNDAVLKLVDRFKQNRVQFIDFCRSLSKEELERDVPDSTYTVKDFVSHLGTLDPALTQQFDALAAGRAEAIGRREDGEPFDIDRYNDALVAERRGWTLDRILEEAAQNREQFLAALAKLKDEQIGQTMRFTGDNKRPPADVTFEVFLKGLTRHDAIHVADMVKALPERSEDPAIKQWINDVVVQWYQKAMAGPATR